MESIVTLLIGTVLVRALDPLVLGSAVVIGLALFSGLAARLVEAVEDRVPRSERVTVGAPRVRATDR